jgi:hypothetical protein
MPLLSGLLRMADILDESRRRAKREKANTLLLDIESQTHWWRHYYTEHVNFDPTKRKVTLWFDFPPDRVPEYSRVVPALQMPWIEAEFNYHRAALAEAGLVWTLDSIFTSNEYSVMEQMPEAVVSEMFRQLSRQRQRDEEVARQASLKSFVDARPLVERRLADLRERRDSLSAAEYLGQLANVSFELWEIGSKRSAWIALVFDFTSNYQHLDERDQVRIGTRLLEMMIADDAPQRPAEWNEAIAPVAQKLGKGDSLASRYLATLVDWYIYTCAYDRLPSAAERAMANAESEEARLILQCKLNEAHFLQGELARLSGL